MIHIFDWWNDLRKRSVKKQVFQQANNQCQHCGKAAAEGVTLEIDHIIPTSRGGRYDISNLQLLCSECNRGKLIGLNDGKLIHATTTRFLFMQQYPQPTH